jgi:hypothetical protein
MSIVQENALVTAPAKTTEPSTENSTEQVREKVLESRAAAFLRLLGLGVRPDRLPTREQATLEQEMLLQEIRRADRMLQRDLR